MRKKCCCPCHQDMCGRLSDARSREWLNSLSTYVLSPLCPARNGFPAPRHLFQVKANDYRIAGRTSRNTMITSDYSNAVLNCKDVLFAVRFCSG